MTGEFVRRVARYPRMFLERPMGGDERSFVRRVAVPPGRFILVDPGTDAPTRQIPPELLKPGEPGEMVTPINPAVFLGRVEEIGEDGSCLVRVWEVPTGQAGTATVTRDQLGKKEVVAGDTLRIYTWVALPVELDADGERDPRHHMRIEITPREVSLPELEALRARVAELEQDASA